MLDVNMTADFHFGRHGGGGCEALGHMVSMLVDSYATANVGHLTLPGFHKPSKGIEEGQ